MGWDEIVFVAKPKARPLTRSVLDAQTSQNLVISTRHGINRIKSEICTLTSYLLDYPITMFDERTLVRCGCLAPVGTDDCKLDAHQHG